MSGNKWKLWKWRGFFIETSGNVDCEFSLVRRYKEVEFGGIGGIAGFFGGIVAPDSGLA